MKYDRNVCRSARRPQSGLVLHAPSGWLPDALCHPDAPSSEFFFSFKKVHTVILHQLVAKDPEKSGLTPDLARATLRLATSRDRYISLLGRFILPEMGSGILMRRDGVR